MLNRLINRLIEGPTTFYTDEKIMNDMSMLREGLQENVCYTEYTQNQLKSKSSNTSKMVVDTDIYSNYYVDHNNIINPYKIVEEEELKLLTNLCDCVLVKKELVNMGHG